MTITRPALRYFGGKWRLAPWIINHFPAHTCYVEPFGGGGNVLLQKEPSYVEVYNDINGAVVNFFKVLRERGNELIKAIELTPYARDEYEIAYQPTDDPLERARRFYIQAWMQRSGYRANGKNSGWRIIKSDARGSRTPVDDWNNIAHLSDIVNRLKNIVIENNDYSNIIKKYDTPETFFYCDPPYVHSTREGRWSDSAYEYEMQNSHHRELARLLNSIEGMAIISGYPSNLYTEIYADWRRIELETSATNQAKTKVEALWLSPQTVKALDAGSIPGGLFDYARQKGGGR